MQEMSLIASSMGRTIVQQDIENTIVMTSSSNPYKPSMLVDFHKDVQWNFNYIR